MSGGRGIGDGKGDGKSVDLQELNLVGKTYLVKDNDDVYYATCDAARRLACPKGRSPDEYDAFRAERAAGRRAGRREFFQRLNERLTRYEP